MRGDFPGKEMFSLGSLWLIFLLQTGAALEYPELYTHSARMGSDTTIPCQFNVDAIPPARRSFAMLWHFQEKEIFRSPNAPKAADPRLSIDQDRIQDGIADLSMSGVSIADGGLYICSMVQTPEGKVVKEIRLDIHAPPQIIITNKTALINKESVLRCAISGFYPVDIDIKWLWDGVVLDNVIMEIPQRDPSGTYSVNSSVTITPTEEDRERTFSYRIQHESLTAPLQEDFRLVFEDEEITKQNILIISVSVAVGVGILIAVIIAAIMYKKRGGKGKVTEPEEDQNRRSVSPGDVQQPPDSINRNKEFTKNQQHGPPEGDSSSQMTGTNPATTLESLDSAVYSSGKVPQTQHSINNANKTSIRNQQPVTREEPNHSQKTKTKPVIQRKSSDTTVYSPGGRHSGEEAENQDKENTKLISGDRSGDVRQPPDSIHNTNRTSKRNPQPEPRGERNRSLKTSTRSAVPPNPPHTTVYRPGGRRSDGEAENQDNENQKLTSGDESGDVRQPPDSINNTNKTSIRNPQPEPRGEPNYSQTTGTKSAAHRKPSDTTAYRPGDVQQPPDSIHNRNKTSIRNPQSESREGRNHSQMTATRSALHRKPSDPAIYNPGNPTLKNQRPGHNQTMPKDQETEPSANNQDAEMGFSGGNVRNIIRMYEKKK